MDILGAGIGIIILMIVINFLVGALFLYLGAAIAGIEGKTFGKAIGAFLLSWIVVAVISGILSFVPIIGTILGFIIGLILSILIVKSIFKTTSGKAFIAILLAWVLSIVVLFLLTLIFGLSVGSMLAV